MATTSPPTTPPKGDGGARKSRPRSKALKQKKGRFSGVSSSSIVLFSVAALVALAIVGYAGWMAWDATRPFGEQRAQKIDGVINYRAKDVSWLTRRHVAGPQTYKTSPAVGGDHNETWQNCEGDVYAAAIPEEHAVHSLEHGAVWITYDPEKLTPAQIATLSAKVKGKNYTLMSPYPGLKTPVSLQAWGFALFVDDVDDSRIDKFLKEYRQEASVEDGATCSGGNTTTGDDPVEQTAA
jgi:hypothetical protein